MDLNSISVHKQVEKELGQYPAILYPGCQRSSRSPAARNVRASSAGRRETSGFERADPITLPFIFPESKFDPGNLIGRLKKSSLKGLLLVKCVMILAKPVLPKCENKRLRMSIKGNRRRHGSEVFFSTLRDSTSPLNSVAPNKKKTSGTQGSHLDLTLDQ